MELLYIDESGSMTSEYSKNNTCFVISILRIIDKKSLKDSFKYFIRKNKDKFKLNQKAEKMFCNEKFNELKGSALTKEQKKDLVEFFSKKNNFEIFYIHIKNTEVDSKYYKNTARAFNYILKLYIGFLIKNKFIKRREDILIQIDERNERPGAKLHLQEYLNTALQLEENLSGEITVKYYDSCNNELIQLADVFSNLYYSHLLTGQYANEFKILKTKKILKHEFIFPLKK